MCNIYSTHVLWHVSSKSCSTWMRRKRQQSVFPRWIWSGKSKFAGFLSLELMCLRPRQSCPRRWSWKFHSGCMGIVLVVVVLCKSGSKQLGSAFFGPVGVIVLPSAKVPWSREVVFHLCIWRRLPNFLALGSHRNLSICGCDCARFLIPASCKHARVKAQSCNSFSHDVDNIVSRRGDYRSCSSRRSAWLAMQKQSNAAPFERMVTSNVAVQMADTVWSKVKYVGEQKERGLQNCRLFCICLSWT